MLVLGLILSKWALLLIFSPVYTRKPAHNLRRATPAETVEHGRWRSRGSPSGDIPTHYREWTLEDRIFITLLCKWSFVSSLAFKGGLRGEEDKKKSFFQVFPHGGWWSSIPELGFPWHSFPFAGSEKTTGSSPKNSGLGVGFTKKPICYIIFFFI